MDSLNSLANTNCFNILQQKLDDWKYKFEHNCTEANISKCCELLELNARIQTQLFKLLGFCGIYGGISGSEGKLKKQLIPYLGKDYLENGITSKFVMDILNDISKQSVESTTDSNKYNKSCPQNNNCSNKRMSNCSSNCSSFNGSKNCPKAVDQGIYNKLNELENIIIDLSNENKSSHKKSTKKNKTHQLKRCDSLPKYLENEITNTDDVIQCEDSPRDFSGSDVEEIRNDTYLQGLVGRYNDLFSESRVNAMDHLRMYNDDHENNQRILFALVMIGAKCVSELQRSYHTMTKDQTFSDSIARSDLKNLRTRIIYQLVNNHGHYSRFQIPNNFSFTEMENLINRTIQLFWNFGAVRNGLKLVEAGDGELFDGHKYRRSYDSDFNAPLVNHHIWPCLIQNQRVLVKGEACTRASNKMVCKVQVQNKKNNSSSNNSNHSRCSSK